MEVFTANEYQVAAEAEMADLKAQGETETAKELAENLTELLNQEIVCNRQVQMDRNAK